MLITEATDREIAHDILARSKYSFHQLSTRVTRIDSGQSMVDQTALAQAGLATQPYWEDDSDLEGQQYTDYIKQHPGFSLEVRQSVFERLKLAQNRLPDDLVLVIKAGWRPVEVQISIRDAFLEAIAITHPNWSSRRQLEYTRQFVSDPAIICPPHTTGGAVDLTIQSREDGRPLDMGSSINELSERAYLHFTGLTAEQSRNRQLLLEVMLQAGFSPNPYEWWHYQYGETFWAAFYGRSATIYDTLL